MGRTSDYAALAGISVALDEISWDWLEETHPQLAGAIMDAVQRGVTADGIYRHVLIETGRVELARRCQQAARFVGSRVSLEA